MSRGRFTRTLLASCAGLRAGRRARFACAAPQARRYTINPDRLRASLEALSRFGRNPEGGVSRIAWTEPDIRARRFVVEELMTDRR